MANSLTIDMAAGVLDATRRSVMIFVSQTVNILVMIGLCGLAAFQASSAAAHF